MAFTVRLDPSARVADPNQVISRLLKTLSKYHNDFIDDFPITKHTPYAFTFSSPQAEERWKKDMGMEKMLDYTADETMEHLKDFFGIFPDLPEEDARDIVAIRAMVFMQRFRQYNMITLAVDVDQMVMLTIEEQGGDFPGIFIEVEPLRYYPEREYLAHILGYIRPVNAEELAQYEADGYTSADLIGKLGIEKAYELTLAGQRGEQTVRVSSGGQVMGREITKPPVRGDDVFLTIDAALQKKTAHILQDNLKSVLLSKLDEGDFTAKQVLRALFEGHKVSIESIMDSSEDSAQYRFRRLILDDNPDFHIGSQAYMERAEQALGKAIDENAVTLSELLLCLAEQEVIRCDHAALEGLRNGTASPYRIIREAIENGGISPAEVNLDPCTGSVVVVDVHTGDILALVTYPSYDNNRLVNRFDNAYYQKLLNDPAKPLINRPMTERKAPGSTLKMLSAMAGLETGTITPETRILDRGVFESAGIPFAKCLIYSRYGGTHGAVNVSEAIEVSCNYFFYEMAYRMGNAKEGTTENSIATLDAYMEKFGLGAVSGAGIEEYAPKMASPESKEALEKALNPNAAPSETRWKDGDSIRCAIGQANNSFAAIHMAKYMATLANGGTRYSLNLVKGIRSGGDIQMKDTPPNIEETLHLAPRNLQVVYEGMLGVTSGSRGTLRQIFTDFPIKVAGKTGTAEESDERPSHAWFTGFAPYEDPQIAVVVMIPFGETKESPAPKIAKEIFAAYFGLYEEPGALSQNALAR